MPDDKPTSADVIDDSDRTKRRSLETRAAKLEDENGSLRASVSSLEKQVLDLRNILKDTPSPSGNKEKSFWDELNDFFKW